jgi:hypothetical protein
LLLGKSALFAERAPKMAKLTVNGRLKRRIANTKREVFMREDFQDIASPSQLSAALKELCETGFLIRLGYGVYARAEISQVTGASRPRQSLEVLGAEFLGRKGIPQLLGRAERDYNSGTTTQIPMKTALYTSGKRISRKLQVGKRVLAFESAK